MKDILNNEIELDSTVAAAMSLGRSVELRLGTVIELVPDKNLVRVKWTHSARWGMVGTVTLIEARHSKLLVVK